MAGCCELSDTGVDFAQGNAGNSFLLGFGWLRLGQRQQDVTLQLSANFWKVENRIPVETRKISLF